MAADESTAMAASTAYDTYEPTVRDLDAYTMTRLNNILHGARRNDYIHDCGPSKMELWKKMATELIRDTDIINTIEKMNMTRSRQWIDDVFLCKERRITITRVIEISKELKRNDIAIQFEEIYNRGVRYTFDMREHEVENIANMMEHNDLISASWKDYADKLHMSVNEMETLYETRTPLLEIVLRYLKWWKPNTTLSNIQKICRDELHNVGANIIERIKSELPLGNMYESEEYY